MALVCALMLMLGALILGVSVARTAFASMASARQERERMVARAAAEAALADAQADLAGGAQPSSARAAWFAAGSGGFVTDCGRGSQDLGLCLPTAAPAPAPALWETLDLEAEDSPVMVPYGRYTGATFASGAGILPARPPGYLIEQLVPAGPGPPASGALYRITAIGFGARANTRVVLQVLFRRPAPSAVPPERGGAGGPGADGDDDEGAGPSTDGAEHTGDGQPPAAGSPTGRIAWREIANWPELHARAMQ
jgi:type IV pilus assembly protein PilX